MSNDSFKKENDNMPNQCLLHSVQLEELSEDLKAFRLEIKEQVGELKSDIKTVDKTLRGNGKTGLITLIDRHATYLKMLGAGILLMPAITGVLISIIRFFTEKG